MQAGRRWLQSAALVLALGRDEMSADQEIQPVLRDLFRSRRYAVLATDDHGQPFASLMAFAVAPSCAIVTVEVSSYLLVSRFEQVLEWRIGS